MMRLNMKKTLNIFFSLLKYLKIIKWKEKRVRQKKLNNKLFLYYTLNLFYLF